MAQTAAHLVERVIPGVPTRFRFAAVAHPAQRSAPLGHDARALDRPNRSC
jgi:hypothetical protein